MKVAIVLLCLGLLELQASTTIYPDEFQRKVAEAASSWGISADKLLEEAENFIMETHLASRYGAPYVCSVTDLIFLKRPNPYNDLKAILYQSHCSRRDEKFLIPR